MTRGGADRSRWIATSIRAKKPSISGEVLVSRRGGAYEIELRFEETQGSLRTILVARLSPAGATRWRLEWTSGNGLWKPLDDELRSIDDAIDAIVRDDFGCFFG